MQRHDNVRIEAPADNKAKKKTDATPAGAKPAAAGKQTAASPPAAKPEPPKAPEFQWHIVQRNESLDDIARKYDVTPESIRKMNGVTDSAIKVGARLKIKQL